MHTNGSINVVLTDHAMERITERGLDMRDVETAVRSAAPFAPCWTDDRTAAALDCTLPADPVVKYFKRKAIVTTLLPHGAPLKQGTEVVYVP